MPGITSYSTSGGSADVTTPNHQIDDLDQVEDAISYAQEALDVAQKLEEANLQNHIGDTVEDRLLNIAVESYIEKFSIPAVALEDNDLVTTDSKETGRLKKIILYLYAVVQRIFTAIFDFFTQQKAIARKIIPLTKDYIGRSDSLSSSIASQLSVKDRSLMIALHIDGIAPQKITELYDALADVFEKQYQFSAVNEVIAVIASVKDKNPERLHKEAEALHTKLSTGFKDALHEANAKELSAFSEKKTPNTDYWVSDTLFGQNYITGVIGTEIAPNGSFTYRCGVRRDPEVPLRTMSFPALAPDEIRRLCRTSLRISENIIRFSRDEALMQKALREASFLITKEPNESAVAALKDIAVVGQSSYVVHLRFVARTMQAMMRYCNASIKLYEGVKENHG